MPCPVVSTTGEDLARNPINVWKPSNINGTESFTFTGRQFAVPTWCDGRLHSDKEPDCNDTATISDDGETISWTTARGKEVFRRQR